MRPYPSGGLRDSGYLNARVYQETPSGITAVGGGGIGNANENHGSWAPGAVTRGSTAGECGNIPKISGGHGVCHIHLCGGASTLAARAMPEQGEELRCSRTQNALLCLPCSESRLSNVLLGEPLQLWPPPLRKRCVYCTRIGSAGEVHAGSRERTKIKNPTCRAARQVGFAQKILFL